MRTWVVAVLVSLASLSSAEATMIQFETTLGNFDVKLYDDTAPVTVENFLDYVTSGTLDGTIVHRLANNFVIQGGGYTTTGAAISTLPPIPLELTGGSNRRGTIAMARTSNPSSATSQWFVNLVDNQFLDTSGGGYAVFGEVVGDGMEVIDAISALNVFRGRQPFGELPILDPQQPVGADNLVVVTRVHVVPEPAGLGLLAIGVLAFGSRPFRRRGR